MCELGNSICELGNIRAPDKLFHTLAQNDTTVTTLVIVVQLKLNVAKQ